MGHSDDNVMCLAFSPRCLSRQGENLFSDVEPWGGDLPNGVCMILFWDQAIKNVVGIGGSTPQSVVERW